MAGKRINKFLSEAGFCSRRQADALIAAAAVEINGKIADLGQLVEAGDEVRVEGKLVQARRPGSLLYLVLNKPRGIICTTDPSVPGNIVDFMGIKERIFTIGRLDKDSEGLLLLTNDGDLVNPVLRAKYAHEKEYYVETRAAFDETFLRRMRSGVPILGTVTKPCRVDRLSERSFRIILTQGLNRQIRRMTEALGHEVVFLRRERVMNISLGSLETGAWRELTPKERGQLFELLSRSLEKLGENKALLRGLLASEVGGRRTAAAKKQTAVLKAKQGGEGTSPVPSDKSLFSGGKAAEELRRRAMRTGKAQLGAFLPLSDFDAEETADDEAAE